MFYDFVSYPSIGKIQYQTDAVVNTTKCIHLDITSGTSENDLMFAPVWY